MNAESSRPDLTGGEALFWSRGTFWIGLALLAMVPFLVAPIPPLPDFPGHVAQYHIMLNLDRSRYLQDFYDYKWTLTGNLGDTFLMLLAGPLLGVERGAWAIAAAAPALMVLGIFAVSRAIHGRVQVGAFLALPFVYAKAFMWGFLNYDLAVALALLAFALWVKLGDRQKLRVALFIPIALAIWLCHAVGWGLLCLFVGGYELQAAVRENGARLAALKKSIVRVLPLLPPALLSAAMIHRSGTPYPVEITSNLPSGLLAYKLFIFAGQLHDRSYFLDVLSIMMIAGMYFFARYRGATISCALAVPAGLAALAAVFLPQVLSGSALADYRVAPVAILMFFLSVRGAEGTGQRLVAISAVALTGLRLTVTAIGWHQDSAAYERHLTALESVPLGARILVLVPTNAQKPYQSRPMGHLADLAVVRRDALVNSQWINTGAIPVQIKANTNSAYYADPSQYVAPEKVVHALATVRPDQFDYVWVLGRYPAADAPDNFSQQYVDEETRFFRIKK